MNFLVCLSMHDIKEFETLSGIRLPLCWVYQIYIYIYISSIRSSCWPITCRDSLVKLFCSIILMIGVWSSAILKGVALTSVFWSWQVIKTVSRGGWVDRTMALLAALAKFDFCKSWEAFDWFTQSKRESHVQNLSV